MIRIIVLVALIGAPIFLASCQRTATDGISIAGNVRPILDIHRPQLRRDDLTDASALLVDLKHIVARAPPVDETNPTSLKEWTKFYDTQKRKIASDQENFLIPISCGAEQTGGASTLTYYELTKNINVTLYTPVPDQNRRAENARKLIDAERHKFLNELSRYIMGYTKFKFDESASDDNVRYEIEKLQDIVSISSSLNLSRGLVVDIDSPINAAAQEIGVAIAKTEYLTTNAKIAISHGKNIDASKVLSDLDYERHKWEDYPYGYLPKPFWSQSVPYSGDPKNVCLIGQFSSMDLLHRADQVSFFQNEKAELYAKLVAWYLVRKSDLKLIKFAVLPQKDQ